MEDIENKALLTQFAHDMLQDESKLDRKNPRRSEPAVLFFYCSCEICYLQSKGKIKPKVRMVTQEKTIDHDLKGFTWLLEKLGEVSCESTCKLNIPDTAVFRKGKPSFLIQHQRDRSLKYITSGEKLTNQEIIKNLTNIVRNRKKEEVFVKVGKLKPAASVEYGKETACIRFMSKNKDNDLDEIMCEDELGAIRVMNENEFTGLMWQRPGSNFWKTIAYIQTTLKCKKGIGESFLHFFKLKNVQTAEIMHIGLDESEENEESVYLEDSKKYCEYIFKKIYYFFERYLNLMLVQIKGEFVRDDNNRIWLIHASNIITVPLPNLEDKKLKENKTAAAKLDHDQLLNHLAIVAKQPKNPRTEKLSRIMSKECEKIIEASKIMDIYKPEEPEIVNSTAFAKLRRFAPYNLEELLDKDKASGLLKIYTENRRKKRKPKGIDYDNKAITQNSFIPRRSTGSWIVVPQTRLSIRNTQKRPMSSKYHSHTKSQVYESFSQFL